MFIGASWQRCRVHFIRDVLAVVPKGNSETVAAAIRAIFVQPAGRHPIVLGRFVPGQRLPAERERADISV